MHISAALCEKANLRERTIINWSTCIFLFFFCFFLLNLCTTTEKQILKLGSTSHNLDKDNGYVSLLQEVEKLHHYCPRYMHYFSLRTTYDEIIQPRDKEVMKYTTTIKCCKLYIISYIAQYYSLIHNYILKVSFSI